MGFDPVSNMLLAFVVGKRTKANAYRLVEKIYRVRDRDVPFFTSDELTHYKEAWEIVGSDGLVVSIEIEPLTFEFVKKNKKSAGYNYIILVKGDGGVGHPEMSPYGRICIPAVCNKIPPPLIEQLREGGQGCQRKDYL